MTEDQTDPDGPAGAAHDDEDGPAGAAHDDEDASLTYEQAREELVEVVARLERGGTTLEESLALWERGEQLARLCQEWLDGARERLDVVLAEDGDEDRGGAT